MGWFRRSIKLILVSGIGSYYLWRCYRNYRQLLQGKTVSQMHLVSSKIPVMAAPVTDPWLGECPRGLALIISERVDWDIERTSYPLWVERYYHQSKHLPKCDQRLQINRSPDFVKYLDLGFAPTALDSQIYRSDWTP